MEKDEVRFSSVKVILRTKCCKSLPYACLLTHGKKKKKKKKKKKVVKTCAVALWSVRGAKVDAFNVL
jgi:hypothetical protein